MKIKYEEYASFGEVSKSKMWELDDIENIEEVEHFIFAIDTISNKDEGELNIELETV